MPTNPFRRRMPSSSQQATAKKGPGLTITQAEGSNQSGTAQSHQGPSNLLLPESDYRTSLIMPHLTRRFTLLRAPDGTMVTPDAMRAHLRAQRARARAAGVPGTQCFLTEEEEDEIIDQLKRQTRLEDLEHTQAAYQQQEDQQSHPSPHHRHQQSQDQMQFGGTDGFGSWATPPAQHFHSRDSSKIDDSLTESLGDLQSGAMRTPSRDASAGGFFGSRSSSSRELAYMREVEKSRAARLETDHPNEEGVDGVSRDLALPRVREEDEASLDTTDNGAATRQSGLGIVGGTEDSESVPGDFLAASKRESNRLSATSDWSGSRKGSDASNLTPRPNHDRKSTLLTNLTPEAFNRVSMALEEVYDMVSGHVSDGDEDEENRSEGATDEDMSREGWQMGEGAEETEELDLEESGRRTFGDQMQSASMASSLDHDDRSTMPKSSTDDGSRPIRASMESETNSFASAHSEMTSSNFDGHLLGRSEPSGSGAVAATLNNGSIPSPAAPAGWQISPSHPVASGSSKGNGRATKSSVGSYENANSPHQGDKTGYRSNPSSFDSPTNGRRRNDRSASDSPLTQASPLPARLPPAVQQPAGAAPPMANPLAAGFHLAGSPGNAAAAAAAATAAGVAAASFVAQAQEQQRALRAAQSSAEGSLAVAPTSEITFGHQQASQPQMSRTESEEGPGAYDPNESNPSGRSPAHTENTVLSAGAIAARSPRYFPAANRQSMRTYAAGFHPTQVSSASMPMPDTEDAKEHHPPQQSVPTLAAPPKKHQQLGEAPASLTSGSSSDHQQGQVPSEPATPSMAATGASEGKFETPRKLQEGIAVPTNAGLMPEAPSDDPDEAARWRERYGITSSVDAQSIRSGTSMNISEDEHTHAGDHDADDEDDVWASVARNTSPKVHSKSLMNPLMANGVGNQANANATRSVPPNTTAMSMDTLQQIQSDLVRSASAKREPLAGQKGQVHHRAPSLQPNNMPPPPMPPPQRPPPQLPLPQSPPPSSTTRSKASKEGASSSTSKASTDSQAMAASVTSPQDKLDKARERAKSLADQRGSQDTHARTLSNSVESKGVAGVSSPARSSVQKLEDAAEAAPPVEVPSKDSQYRRPLRNATTESLRREPSIQSSRSQVMYDVTTSHRPTSPPPRTHKKSLSNLPTLQDLNKSAATGSSLGPTGAPDRNSTSLLSMMEATTRVHDQLAAGNGEATILEESVDEYEDVPVEDGFGGFTWERRKRMPRSRSHDVLSSVYHAERDPNVASPRPELSSPFTPKSFRSEPTGEERAGKESTPTWSRLPGEEPFVSPDLIDDVAEQARAATHALKGESSERPRLRSKSLNRRARKHLLSNISQPHLVSTSQHLQHTKEVPRVDGSLRRKKSSTSVSPTSSRQPQTLRSQRSLIAERQGTLAHSESTNTLQSTSPQSPTDYKTEGDTTRKASVASVATLPRRSSSFRRPPDEIQPIMTPTRSTSKLSNGTPTSSSFGTPTLERSQTGLSRFMSRIRGGSRKTGDLPALIEPFIDDGSPSTGQNGRERQSPTTKLASPAAINSQGNDKTPGSMASPTFKASKDSPNLVTQSPGKADGFPSRIHVPQPGQTPLSDMFTTSYANPPPRSASQGLPGAEQRDSKTPSSTVNSALLAPAAPIHARQGTTEPAPARGSHLDKASARDTIVRRTIIVSTYEPNNEERRKSLSANRKNSLRKQVDRQSAQPSSLPKQSTSSNGHRRSSSTSSSLRNRRRSVQDRPPTPPGPEGVSGTHRKKLSQDATGMPLPATARNVYEAPAVPLPSQSYDGSKDSSGMEVLGGLSVPSASRAASSRASGVSEYGVSLYDMYIDDDEPEVARKRSQSNLAPPLPLTSQSMSRFSTSGSAVRQSALDGANARHIEVTERADGSVVWQVIAGLADRSSSYSGSIGYDVTHGGISGGHSRQASDGSIASFLRNPAAAPSPSMAHPNAYVDEDGRSLFARTRGKKSFSIDGQDVPPLPAGASAMGDQGSPMGKAAMLRPSMSSTSSQAQQAPLDFEMATSPGQAATRIVYTSDAELAAILESLAGPDKSSAKFAFQRVYDEQQTPKERGGSGEPPLSNGAAPVGERKGRPVSIWTEGDSASDPMGMLRTQRIKIEAEIYSLLQRDQATLPHPQAAAPPPPLAALDLSYASSSPAGAATASNSVGQAQWPRVSMDSQTASSSQARHIPP